VIAQANAVDDATLADDEAPHWLLPRQAGSPVNCLRRIRWICQAVPDLFEAVLLVCATHQGVPRPSLAAAIKRYHPAVAALSVEDVQGLVNGLLNGGRDGLEAVQRSRKNGARRQSPMPFLRPD
jgi:hypothetical protein